jgi:hypothetical protein
LAGRSVGVGSPASGQSSSEFALVPNVGVGPAQFGHRPAQVLAAMGESPAYEGWMGGNLNDALLFAGLVLGFDACDAHGPLSASRFVEARICGRENASLFGTPLVAWTRASLVAWLRERGHVVHQSADDVNVEALGLSLSFSSTGQIQYAELRAPAGEQAARE